MKKSLIEQEEVSTRRSRRARKRVQDSNFVFIWFWIPDLRIYLLARHVQRTFDEDKHENQMFSLSIVYWDFFTIFVPIPSKQQTKHVMTLSVCKNVWILISGATGSAANVLRPPPPPPLGPCYIDTSVLLENIPPVKFMKTTSGTPMVYFPLSHTWVLSMT